MTSAERIGDNGPEGNRLVVSRDEQGDMYVQILPKNHIMGESVRFCTSQGGGMSLRTRKALVDLFNTIQEENQNNPQRTNSLFEDGNDA